MTDPATDCPPCPKCTLPCGSTDAARVFASEPVIMCVACGHFWEGTPAEVAQADAADAAFRAQEAAEEAHAKRNAEAERDAARLAELMAMKARGEAT